MAFASVVGAPTRNNSNTSGTAHSITLPATVNADEKLLVLVDISGNSALGWDNTTAGDWGTALYDTPGGTLVRSAAYQKTADGTEGGKVLSITTGAASRAIWHIYRLSGAGTIEAVASGVDSAGNVSNPNPPNLTSSGGAEDNLWIVHIGNNSTFVSSSADANYATNIADTTPTSGVSIHSAYRTNTAASEDPSVWTLGAARRCVSNTIVVRPADAPVVEAASDWLSLVRRRRRH